MAGNPFLSKINGIVNPFNNTMSKPNQQQQMPAMPQMPRPNNFNQNQVISTAANAVTTAGNMLFAGDYNAKVGMEKPNALNTFTDLQMTGMGASIGGPVGAGVGFGVDMLKNILAWKNRQHQYNQAVNKQELSDGINARLGALDQDFTGYARFGMKMEQPKNVEMEANEIVLVQTPTGDYKKYAQTSPSAPSHEEGGVQTSLPKGALVFPQKYKARVEAALEEGDTETIENLAAQMQSESELAAELQKPYSNHPAKVAQILRYGAKIC